MDMKIPLLSWGLKLSNLKPGCDTCEVSALHFFVKQIPPMDFLHGVPSDKPFFSFLSKINPCFTAEKRIGV
jgi:hypothetical protein